MKKMFILLCMVVSISLLAILEIKPMGDDEYIDIVYEDNKIKCDNLLDKYWI